ncbi:hypothetical protein CspeluHIS016_0201310 [Cutaneotrichosporon spelunceum]|uniref:Uncharacterized protein n=1 Tax=Cutaneotrichosporon spelunceum TaxID=1672016 RepID=A0AAD3TRI2_9TREE|nr:hypothetical protein CspeluHIS016_0201310 [Cutaneotrichosporon spelunceum]
MVPSTRPTSSPRMDYADPVLAKLAETGTFDCEWETLRHHLYLALLAVLPVFLEKGKPAVYTGAVPIRAVSPMNTQDGRVHIDHIDDDLRPSTQGGLVIRPFPPLVPNRRRPHVMVINAGEGRLNGTGGRGNPFEDEWDEEVIIGGRKLPGWLDEEESKREVNRVAQRIEELTSAPFTVQRLAELLLVPTKLHSTLGKFLRAVEKTLNVTTPYEPPSYTYVPPPSLFPMESEGSPSASPASMCINSTVPPGSMTPMFSPIPWASGGTDALGEPMLDVDDGHGDDGLMSPLMLSEGSGVFASQQGRSRSPTPGPEDEDGEAGGVGGDDNVSVVGPGGSRGRAVAEGPDPGHEPYLGRVDELDSGPIVTNGFHGEDSRPVGVGEGGNMPAHGMSNLPVPLSSTTVIGEPRRDIAPLPRRGHEGEHGPEAAEEAEERGDEGNPEGETEAGVAAGASPAEPEDKVEENEESGEAKTG